MNHTSLKTVPAVLCSALLLWNAAALADEAPATAPSETATPVATPAPEAAPAASTAPIPAAPAPASTGPLASWEVLPEKSSIEWTANYAGKTVNGSFKDFTSNIVFDPERLEQSHVKVTIDIAKITSDDKDAEQALPGADWFDAAKVPQAVFEAKTFRHLQDEQYEADGTLSLGDKQVKLTLPFSVHFYDDTETVPAGRYAQVTAETTLKRTELGVGKGDWSKTDTVADDVKVTIGLKAKSSLPPTAP